MNSNGILSATDAVKILSGNGYDVCIGSDGIVVIYIDFEKYLKEKDTKKYTKLMDSIGYFGSWGLKPKEAKPGD